IAIDHNDAIIHGGYKPTGCYWLDVRYGGFATSSYYTPILSQWVTDFNAAKVKWDYTNALWAVERSIDRYVYKNATSILLDSTTKFTFDMLFKPKNREFKRLLETPMGNSYLKDFAIEVVKRDSLGGDESTDLLVVNFASQRNISRIYGTSSTETEDAYYKLDKDIAQLVEYLDNNIGSQNFVIVLTSSHGMSDNVTKKEASNEGKFNAMQFKVLISGFLNAQLGADNWVVSYRNRQIYLNRRLIYEKNLSLQDIQNRVATFALQFAGVANAVTATTLQTNYFGKGILSKMQNSFFPRHSGDLMINLLPGWIELDDENDVTTSSLWGSSYEYDSHIPLIFYGKGINPQIIHSPVDLVDVAPTICEMVGVTNPNASSGKAINEIISSK
ncbi:MAG: alkaline phosphatase family protein, partial [Rikenellaceae bacterium]